MKNYRHYFIALFCFLTIYSSAQTSVVQDTKGETAIPFGGGGAIAINAKEESISFSFGAQISKNIVGKTNEHTYGGFSAKAKGKTGLGSIVKNDQFQYDGNFGVFLLNDRVSENGNITNWYGSADLLFSQFKLFDLNKSFDKQVYDKNNLGFKITSGGSFYRSLNRIPILLGIAINGGTKNNSGELKNLDVSLTQTILDPLTSQTRTIEKDKSTPFNLVEYKQGLGYINFNMDFGPQLYDRFQVLFHSRYSVLSGRKSQWNPAIGIYLNKDGAPLELITGVQVQYLDFFNTSNSLKTRGERMALNIVAGFTF